MARPKKEDKPQDNAPAQITVDAFKRNRDAVVAGLTSLQNSIGILLRAYLQDSNRLLGYDLSAGLDAASFDNLLNNAAIGFGAGAAPTTTAGAEDVKPKRKKREKKERDKNAPKRPLTAYFLYAQHARPVIKRDLEKELGPDLKPQMIANEATRRWKELSEEARQQWKNSYLKSYEEYKKVLADYNAGRGLPHSPVPDPEEGDEVPDEAAIVAVMEDGEEDHESATDDDTDDEEEEQEAPPPPPKAPSPPPVKTPKTNKRRKPTKENGDAAAAPVTSPTPAVSTTRVPLPSESSAPETSSQVQKSPERKRKSRAKEASPEEQRKKRSRKSKGGEEDASPTEALEPVMPAVEKKEKRSKKRKSEAAQA